MSLILEALRKLEREKAAPEQRGFVVLGSPAGDGGRGGSRGLLLAALLAIATGVLGAGLWHRLRPVPAPKAVAEVAPPQTLRAVPAPPAAPRAVPAPPAAPPAAPAAVPAPALDRGPLPSEAAAPVPSPTAAARPRFRLQAITRRDGQPVAILDERLVREGDLFDGVRVLRIGELEIELEVDGRRVVVGF